jgi:type I restriction enzyme S subunit
MNRSGSFVRLGEISVVQTGPFGSQLHSSDYVESGTPIISVEHIRDTQISSDGIPQVGEHDAYRLRKYQLEEGDLVFSRVGAIDRCAYTSAKEDSWLFSGRLLRVRPRRDAVEPRYLLHYLNYDFSRAWILSHAVGSTMPCLNTSILSHTPIWVPDLPVQRWIAEILDTLDDQIRVSGELIKKRHLLKIGLFRDLFVASSEPKRIQLSELTEADICYGIVQAGKHIASGVPVLTISDLLGDFQTGIHRTSNSIDRQYARSRTRSGDVLISVKGTVGRIAVVPNGYDGNISRDIARIRFRPSVDPEFARQYLISSFGQRDLDLTVVGTTRAEISIHALKRLMFPVPPLDHQMQIATALRALDAQIRFEERLFAKLVSTKAALMADLLSGRVRVPTGASS